MQSFKVAIEDNADTANVLYKALENTQGVTIVRYNDKDLLADDMVKGKLAGIINIQKNPSGNPPYNFTLKTPIQVMISGRNLRPLWKV